MQALSPRAVEAATKDESNLVEINYPIDVQSSYKERRRTHGANFGIHLENYIPGNWSSLVDSGFYNETYGKTPISLTSVEGGYKYNFALGGISLLAGIGNGQASADVFGATRTMSIFKYYARGMYTIDNLFPEPYVVPYVAGAVWQMKIKETESGSSFGGSVTSGIGFDYSLGVLLQLNALDQEIAQKSLNENGIENTFLDFFVTQYLKTLKASDSNLSSNFIFGLGLRLEF